MRFLDCALPGLVIIEPTVFEDSRGYFYEAYNYQNFLDNGIQCKFIQDNQSCSVYGVIRGLHYQLAPFAQSKLVRVIKGEIRDVALDIRKTSPTYGRYFSINLSAENKKQLFIPPGFAHGFSVVSRKAIVLYKSDAFYNKESEAGILFKDKELNIDWGIQEVDIIVSEKDLNLPSLMDCINNFRYNY